MPFRYFNIYITKLVQTDSLLFSTHSSYDPNLIFGITVWSKMKIRDFFIRLLEVKFNNSGALKFS